LGFGDAIGTEEMPNGLEKIPLLFRQSTALPGVCRRRIHRRRTRADVAQLPQKPRCKIYRVDVVVAREINRLVADAELGIALRAHRLGQSPRSSRGKIGDV